MSWYGVRAKEIVQVEGTQVPSPSLKGVQTMSTTPEKLCDITTHFEKVVRPGLWDLGGWDGELHVEVWRNRGCVDLSVYTDVSGNRTQLLQVCGVDNDVVPYITNIRDAFNKGVDVFLAQFGSAAKTE